MDTGVKISIAAHAGLIALGLSGSFFQDHGEPPLEVLSVDFLSADEFAALTPDAPRASDAPEQPTPEPEDTEVAIATPEPEPVPVEPVVEPEVLPEVPTAPETPEAPESPQVVVEPEPEVTPKQADRVAPEAAPEAPDDAEEAPVKVEAPKPEPKAEPAPEPTPEVVEQAPKEATTEIVTEADEPKTNAPLTSPTPKARPKNLPKPKPKVAEKPKEKPKPVDNTANDILKAIEADQKKQADAAAKASTTNGTGGGKKLSKGEINGLILKVQDCWSVPVGLRNAANLVVTLRVELSPHGRLVDVPKIIEPAGSLSPEQQQAFESARRALIACQPYQLPQEKYESWNTMEVVFNPKKMVLRQ